MSTLIPVRRKLLTAKRSRKRPKPKVNTFASRADEDNTDTSLLPLSLKRPARDTNLSTASSAAESPKNSFRRSTRVLKKPRKPGSWPDIQRLILKPHFLTEVTMRLTLRKLPLRSPERWLSKTPLPGPSQC